MMMRKMTSKEASTRARDLKLAILACFASKTSTRFCALDGFSEEDWRRIMFWLDISGMALYLLDQMNHADLERFLPKSIEQALQERWHENKKRTAALMREASIIAGWFEQALIPYALLKGFSLTPDSVPDPTLRWQTDLDFMVPKKSAELASHYVRRLGYSIHANSGETIEFQAGEAGVPDLANIYRVHNQRSLELHVLARDESGLDLLSRTEVRSIGRFTFSVLSGPDILVQQARHLLKHLCGEHTRMSWVLEFRRHAESRKDDAAFWHQVRLLAEAEDGNLAMAIALWLATDLFGEVAPQYSGYWASGFLPKRVKLWLELYGRELLLADSIGSKLYAILRQELPGRESGTRNLRKILLPACLPARVTTSGRGETLSTTVQRVGIEVGHFWSRLRFHVVEGLRFAVESTRWRRAVARVQD